MGKALYRTYRSQKLSEIVGQEHITQTLTNALKSGAISHAYLFTGPRGVGKTSIARILAHELNKLPYSDTMHLDIIEIDAASNRRIDEIRDLRDKVHIAPSSAAYKVYIIDEVHMLTREAFNALLKTLEEPPAHAVFILATTEVHKLPETIISRTQRFTFKPVNLSKVAAHLKEIAKKEKIKIDDEALALIAAHGEGSFRDSISLLDQTRSLGRAVTKADVESILGIAPAELVQTIVQAIVSKDAGSAVTTLSQLFEQGSEAASIAKQIAKIMRDSALATPLLPKPQLIHLLTRLIDVPAAADPRVYLEIVLLETALDDSYIPQAPPITPIPNAPMPPSASGNAIKTAAAPTLKPTPTQGTPPKKASEKIETTPEPTTQKPAEDQTPSVGPGTATLDSSAWPAILTAIKNKKTLHSVLKSAEAHFEGNTLKLVVGFAFHQKQLGEAKNKKIISDVIYGVTGEHVQIESEIGTAKPSPVSIPEGEVAHTVASTNASARPDDAPHQDYYAQQADEDAAKRPLSAITNVFGGAEIL